MMLEISLADSIIVRYDDDMNDIRPTPEVVEDYLIRMRRTAIALYDGLPNDNTDDDAAALAALDPDEGES